MLLKVCRRRRWQLQILQIETKSTLRLPQFQMTESLFAFFLVGFVLYLMTNSFGGSGNVGRPVSSFLLVFGKVNSSPLFGFYAGTNDLLARSKW